MPFFALLIAFATCKSALSRLVGEMQPVDPCAAADRPPLLARVVQDFLSNIINMQI